MKNILVVLTLMGILLFSETATASGNEGVLYFIRSNQFHKMNLDTFETAQIYTGEIIASPIILFDNNILLVRNNEILKLYKGSKCKEVITKGHSPCYMPECKTLFFYREECGRKWLLRKGENGERKIALGPIDNSQFESNINGLKSKDRLKILPPVKYSDESIMFIGSDEALWIYSLKKEKIENTKITDCYPLIAIKDRILLCKSRIDKSIFTLNMYNNKKDTLPFPKKTGAFAYNKQKNILYFTTVDTDFFIKEVYPLMSYNLSNGETKELIHDFPATSLLWAQD